MINFKKLLAGTLSAAMVLGTTFIPAFADEKSDVYGVGENQTYSNLKAAFDSSADSDGDGVITYEVYGKVNLDASGWVSPTKKDSGIVTVNFVGKTSDAEIVINTDEYTSIDSYQTGKSLTAMNFKDLTCSRPQGKWVDDLGHGNNYFIATLRDHEADFDGTVSYENCTFTNGVCNNFYGNTNFTNCTFKSDSGKSGLWIYGGKDTKVEGENNKFEGARGVKVYCEKANLTGINVTIENAVFNVTERPAIESSMASKIALKNVDASQCAKGLLTSEPKDGRIDLNSADITVDGEAPVFVAKVGTKAFTNKAYAETVATEKDKTAEPVIAQIGSSAYTSLAEAFTAAQEGDTIKILSDVTESVEIAAGKNITLDLNGKTLTNTEDANTITNNGTLEIVDSSADKTGKVKNANTSKAILFNAGGATATLNGGTFERTEPKTYYAIKNLGTMSINEGVTVSQLNESSSAVANGCANSGEYTDSDVNLTINGGTFVRGLITIKNDECGVLEINGGSFENIKGNYTVFNWNKAVINDGTFKANYVVGNGKYNDKAVGDIDIKGGTFNGIICPDQPAVGYTPYPSEDISISGGTFSTDVSDYCADGYQLAKNADGKYVAVPQALTNGIEVKFEQVEGNAGLYNIVLKATDTNAINRLTTADLTFILDTEDAITYEIKKVGDMNVTPKADNYNRYLFNFDGKNTASATVTEIVIGQVEFTGYGTFKFSVDSKATTNIVNATKTVDNIVTSYVVNGGTTTSEGTLDLGNGIPETELKPETANLTVNVSFPNAIEDNAVDYQNMKVTVSGNGTNEVVKLGSDNSNVTFANDTYTVEFTDKLVKGNTYTVTVEGAGYRTARYTVSMTGAKTLNFWNNVKTAPAYVEENVGNPTDKNFLAGDIVKDGQINIYDLSAVVSYFGTDGLSVSNHPEYAKYDLNRDRVIDSMDISYVLVSWGK